MIGVEDPQQPALPATSQDAELRRRQRARNLVLLFVLIGVAALFYAISVVKFKVH